MLAICLMVYGVVALSHIVIQLALGHLEFRRTRNRYVHSDYQPSVTVVVPVYNEDPDRLEHCLSSVFMQDYDDLEILSADAA